MLASSLLAIILFHVFSWFGRVPWPPSVKVIGHVVAVLMLPVLALLFMKGLINE